MAKLDVKAFGLACGIFFAVWIFLLGMCAMLFGLGTKYVELISCCYIGFKPTLIGSIIGALWAFVDGGICGALFALLYNKISK